VGLQKDELSKEEETRLSGCSYNSGEIVGITDFNAFGGELKVKKILSKFTFPAS
jgi:hypothetical protein